MTNASGCNYLKTMKFTLNKSKLTYFINITELNTKKLNLLYCETKKEYEIISNKIKLYCACKETKNETALNM